MKNALIIISIGFFLIGCNKDKVQNPIIEEENYYQSNGNLLILKVGDEFEEAYEYIAVQLFQTERFLKLGYLKFNKVQVAKNQSNLLI
jgi:hypothetical protein